MKTIISLAIGILSLSSQAASLTLAWDASTTTNVVSYMIEQLEGTNKVVQSIAPVKAPATNTITFNNLFQGHTYSYTAFAINDAGLISDPSNVFVYTVPTILDLPAFTPQRSVATVASGIWTFTVSWSGVTNKAPYGFTNYFVNVISKDSTNNIPTPNTSLLVKGFPVDDLIISVTATNANGPSPINNVLVMSKNPPASPALRIFSSTP